MSTLKAPTGSSSVGEGFCGHNPPHSPGSVLDCVATTELKSNEGRNITPAHTMRSAGDASKFPLEESAASDTAAAATTTPRVKVSQISISAKPHCIKTATPPITARRSSGSVAPFCSKRKSLSSPEPMSIGGDETTSSEKGSRSPSPPGSSQHQYHHESSRVAVVPPIEVDNMQAVDSLPSPLDNELPRAANSRDLIKVDNADMLSSKMQLNTTKQSAGSPLKANHSTVASVGESTTLTENDNFKNGNVDTNNSAR